MSWVELVQSLYPQTEVSTQNKYLSNRIDFITALKVCSPGSRYGQAWFLHGLPSVCHRDFLFS